MGRRRTPGQMTRSEKKENAMSLFRRHWRDMDIARKLGVHRNTVARWRAEYEENLSDVVSQNPRYLEDVLTNTVRMIDELDEQYRMAMMDYGRARVGSPERKGLLDTTVRIQDQKSKVLGLVGVKQEVLRQVVAVRAVQDVLLKFMREQLCSTDRLALERVLQGPELAQYVTNQVAIPEAVDVAGVPA